MRNRVLGTLLGAAAALILGLPRAGNAAERSPTVLWNVTLDAGGFDSASGSAVGSDGHPVAAGRSCALDFSACDFRTVKYDALTGAILWNVSFDSGGGNGDEVLAVAIGVDGHPVVTGFSCLPDGTACDVRTIKYNGSTGAILWNVTFNSGGANIDEGVGVTIGADGHPVVAGASCAPDFTACDTRTIKYDGTTGAILWNVTFDSGTEDVGFRIATGPDGHPVVPGFSCASPFTTCDFRTIKYNGSTGAIIWNVTFDSGQEDLGFGAGIGADGHPVVGGSTCPTPNTACDSRVIKYDGGTGGVIWNVTFDSGGGNFDEAEDVTVGADGHPVIAGQSCVTAFPNCDFRTMKLDGATGTVLWNVTFTGPGDHDVGLGVNNGIDGNPVVTGVSCANYPVCDFRTIKYLLQNDTPAGSNVVVALNGGEGVADGVTVNYATVSTVGSSTLTTTSTGPTPPAGFSLGSPPTYYDLATTAGVGGPIEVCVNYTNRAFAPPESDLRLFHFEGGVWVDRTASLNPETNVICATVSSLSLFAIGHPKTLTPVVHEATTTGGSSDQQSVTTSTAVAAVNGDLYLAAISTKPNVAATSVEGLGLTWTLVEAQCGGRAQTRVEVWKAQGTPTFDGPVTATLAATPKNAVIAVSRHSGTTGVGGTASANTVGAHGACSGGVDSNTYTVNLTTTATVNNALAYGAVAIRHKSHTPGGGFTERAEIAQGSRNGDKAGLAVEDKPVASPSTVAVNGTLSGTSDWAVIGVEIMP